MLESYDERSEMVSNASHTRYSIGERQDTRVIETSTVLSFEGRNW